MRITVENGVFIWRCEASERRASKLFAPLICRGETIEVFQDGQVVGRGEFTTVGTHGPFECFEGLSQCPSRYSQRLLPEWFGEGDELHIHLDPETDEGTYWRGLTLEGIYEI